jgi:hypothetical protein
MSAEDIARIQLNLIADPPTGTKFPAIAYHLLIDGNAQINICHDLNTRTWHSAAVVAGKGRNYTHVGICYTGDYQPTNDQIISLREAVKWVREQLGRYLPIEMHRSVYPTQCPGSTAEIWMPLLES